uniref:Uncharacterized protein n=1 Tax=Ciona savignyi TaxID=51511 RepID=H2Z1E5_CIOSA
MVLKYTGEELYNSTYASLYKKNPEDTKCRPKYNQLVGLTMDPAIQVECRNHPDYIGTRKFVRPPGLTHDYPICLGLGSYVDVPVQNTDKPIVRTQPPQDWKLTSSNLTKVKTSRMKKMKLWKTRLSDFDGFPLSNAKRKEIVFQSQSGLFHLLRWRLMQIRFDNDRKDTNKVLMIGRNCHVHGTECNLARTPLIQQKIRQKTSSLWTDIRYGTDNRKSWRI